MWRNYWTVAVRALAKSKTYSLINIVGLAIGMAACMALLLYVRFEHSYDAWLPNLAPSETLLHRFQSGKVSWAQFAKTYQVELFESAAVDDDNPRIKNHGQKFTLRLIKELAAHQPVTLLCSCAAGEMHCHRHVLKKLLESSKV